MLLWTLGALWLQCLVLITASSSSEEEDGSSERDSEEHLESSSHPHWKHDDQNVWPANFYHCGGTSQSPININTRTVIFDPSLPKINLEGYDLPCKQSLKLKNNGHTLQLSLPETMRIVQGFNGVFLAKQLHFHWGTPEIPGSEHTVDNTHFPAEIHVVHYNSKYGSIDQAVSQPDGLVVLGVLLGIGLHDNENYEKILSSIKNVSTEDSDTEIPGFNVRLLLPDNLERFYRYNGSLTTPPCFQSVTWTVFNESITLSRKQMAMLEDTLKAHHSHSLTKNFRIPQPLHGRPVLCSFRELPAMEGPRSYIPYESDVDPSKDVRSKNEAQGPNSWISSGDIWATAFGTLFTVTLLSFLVYAYRQQKKYSRLKNGAKQNVIYKPASKDDV
uniref:Carbonic anhydrase n=1 Tax=Paramormyrops kingsleyae TaxID=1676925 RepID=A0A3B3QSG0_9TELE|nr:carbonic anhydrase 14-like [Paramormyrops kingsleyae]